MNGVGWIKGCDMLGSERLLFFLMQVEKKSTVGPTKKNGNRVVGHQVVGHRTPSNELRHCVKRGKNYRIDPQPVFGCLVVGRIRSGEEKKYIQDGETSGCHPLEDFFFVFCASRRDRPSRLDVLIDHFQYIQSMLRTVLGGEQQGHDPGLAVDIRKNTHQSTTSVWFVVPPEDAVQTVVVKDCVLVRLSEDVEDPLVADSHRALRQEIHHQRSQSGRQRQY